MTTCNPSTLVAEAGVTAQSSGQPGLHNEFKASLKHTVRDCLTKEREGGREERRGRGTGRGTGRGGKEGKERKETKRKGQEFFLVPRIKHKTLHLADRHCSAELCPRPWNLIFIA